MSGAASQPSATPVQLELEDKARLGGKLTPAGNNTFLLDGLHLVAPGEGGGKVSVKPGMRGVLLADNGNQRTAITIESIKGNTLLVRPVDSGAEETKKPSRPEKSPSPAPRRATALTGSSAENTRLLEELHSRSMVHFRGTLQDFFQSAEA